jgi:hypothetical protein
MKAEEILKDARVYVWKERFAIVKARKPAPNALAVIQDKAEITVVIEQARLNEVDPIKVLKDWRILTFDVFVPLSLAGFISKVSQALAKENVNIFLTSTFSTDHVLVEEKNLEKAINTLKKLGCKVEILK